MRGAFWASCLAILYTYILYPVLVVFRGRLRQRPHKTGAGTPNVTLILAARNEALNLPMKLDNIAELDYPQERLQVIVASDGSTDQSEQIVAEHDGADAEFLALPRLGKCGTLNVAISHAHGEIVVFSDANSVYRKNALRELVRPFVDPDVGGVAGNQVYHQPSEQEGVIAGERRYWNFDRMLKRNQSRAGSAIGGTGAIYAVRKSLLSQIPDGVSDDLYNTLSVVRLGKRLVFAPDAIAYEWVSRSAHDEYARKVRVMVRGLRCVWVMRRLLNPARYGFFAVQLFTQKVLMRAMAVPLAIAATSALILARRRRLYTFAALAQALFYCFASVGLTKGRSGFGGARIFTIPAYFCLVNAGSVQAWWQFLRGDKLTRWEPKR